MRFLSGGGYGARLAILTFSLMLALASGSPVRAQETHTHDQHQHQAPPAEQPAETAKPAEHSGHEGHAGHSQGQPAPEQEEHPDHVAPAPSSAAEGSHEGHSGHGQVPPQEGQEGQEGHDMHQHQAGAHSMAGHAGMHEMQALYGPYGMTRETSGTAWQPDSAPHTGYHFSAGGWELMAHGMASLVYDDQEGPRGGEDTFSPNMGMVMGSRPLGVGRLGVRTMLSLEPWTIGKEGYPLLLQTGETADGVTPLVDAQHPHDLFMELAATYSVPLSESSSVFGYVGLPGEPALGPPAFMHRFSAMENPEAPLAHHWLDSTHITYGVATLGWVTGPWKLEGSVFTGREPDENREGIESPKMDSWSTRLSWNPTPDWSLQASHGRLKSPEQLEPEVDTDRTTLSAIYNRRRANGNWQTVFAWGRNAKDPGETTDALLLESALSLEPRHTLFARVERQENDELVPGEDHEEEGGGHHGEVFDVGKLSAGYVYDLLGGRPDGSDLRLGLGGVATLALIPEELEDLYGDSRPLSFMLFLRLRN